MSKNILKKSHCPYIFLPKLIFSLIHRIYLIIHCYSLMFEPQNNLMCFGNYSFIKSEYTDFYSNEKKISYAIIAFTIMTIVLSCIGLIGLVTFIIELKTKEIAVRKVCGAKTLEIITLLNKSIIIWFFVGFFISSVLSWVLLSRWLENFAFRVTLNGWTFVLGALTIMAITAMTVSIQTWKAAIKNPVETLNYE